MNARQSEEHLILEQIISSLSPIYSESFDSYLEYLQLKKVWKSLEKRRMECEYIDRLDRSQIEKLKEWEKKARRMFCDQEDCVISFIKKISNKITDKEIKNIEKYILGNDLFKQTIKKKSISINDDIEIIRCRFIYTIYMMRVGRAISFRTKIK